MSARGQTPVSRVAGFRGKLLLAMMLVVGATTTLALYLADRSLVTGGKRALQRAFETELAALSQAQEIRQAALVERCRALVRRARIHAALEDGALDLLYPNAEDELRDVMARATAGRPTGHGLRAKFYRFLDRQGRVIPTVDARRVGDLRPAEEARMALPAAPSRQQLGYLVRHSSGGGTELCKVIAMPIVSTDSGEVIAALVLGFEPHEFGRDSDLQSGLWLDGALHSWTLTPAAGARLAEKLPLASPGPVAIEFEDEPHLFFSRQLNSGSSYLPAHEICLFPLSGLQARQRQLRLQVLGAGAVLLLVGLGASHLVTGRFSAPVEKLAVDSAAERSRRARAEAALEMTSAELQRAARFSADASHQLKTPVTVLRAGLEELLAHEHLTAEECHAIAALIHQTYRLSSLIEDLLLLSRMDAGRLRLELTDVDLTRLVEASLDDLSATPDGQGVTVDTDFPSGLTIGNTGRPIAPGSQAHIFERFHRGVMAEDAPGYGLGLNLARELARLHQGELRLVQSQDDWTEFEIRFRPAPAATTAT